MYPFGRVPQASVHDDRMMLELAEKVGGVIVSNDKFSDVARDKADWKRISRDFVCTFIFVKDVYVSCLPTDIENGSENVAMMVFEIKILQRSSSI